TLFGIALSGVHGHIDRKPFAGAAAPLRRPTRAGIMRILVRAEEENRRILFKAMLRTVSVMHIPVDDEHAAQTVLFLNVARRDSHVVEKTKTHRPVGFRMVT